MSLKHAILGLLEISPFTGYDLSKHFKGAISFYWSATHPQIYRELKKLLKDGSVEQEIINQQDAPNKKLYHITEKGSNELKKWLLTPQELPQIRHKFLLQLSFAEHLNSEQTIKLLNSYKNKIESQLSLYNNVQPNKIENLSNNNKQSFLWKSVLKNGLYYYEAELKWINEVIEEFKLNFGK